MLDHRGRPHRACDHKNPQRDRLGRCIECWPGGKPSSTEMLWEKAETAEEILARIGSILGCTPRQVADRVASMLEEKDKSNREI